MKRPVAALAAVLLAAAACRTGTQPRGPSLPEPVPAKATSKPPSPYVTMRVRQANDILVAARAAALEGDAGELAVCQFALAEMLAQNRELVAQTPVLTVLASDAIRELDRLAAAVEAQQENGDDDETEEAGADAVPTELEPAAAGHVAEIQNRTGKAMFDLPVVVNADVTALIDFYTGRYRERFEASLERGANYLPYIREELHKASLPEDLAYLPLIESGFNPKARSRARAQGLWQFIKGTARLYDLRVDTVIDERNDPFLATQAAIHHLQDLYGMFGDWELVLAAYNSGAGRVQRALARTKNGTDFWSVRRNLPRETRNYVPAMWAALVVAKSPEAFSFPRFEERTTCLDRVAVSGALDLEVLADRTGIPVEELAAVNPALVRRLTPADGTYQLAVPCGFGTCASETLAAIPEQERVKKVLYVVKKGDTPSSIAKRYGSSVDALVAANSSRILHSLKVGETVIVPKLGVPPPEGTPTRQARRTASTKGSAKPPARVASSPAKNGAQQYVVRQGDTLYDIARRHGTTTAELQRLNKIQGTRIHPGDVLVVAD
jgi:membrane-bound lytic murein transglycosylase D